MPGPFFFIPPESQTYTLWVSVIATAIIAFVLVWIGPTSSYAGAIERARNPDDLDQLFAKWGSDGLRRAFLNTLAELGPRRSGHAMSCGVCRFHRELRAALSVPQGVGTRGSALARIATRAKLSLLGVGIGCVAIFLFLQAR